MKRSKHSRETTERPARCDEDRAAVYIEKFPPIIAFATALAVEIFLAELWSVKHRKMLERGDNPVVFQISDDDFERMRQLRAMVPRDEIDLIAMHEIMRLFDGLPYDQRWKVASAVVVALGVTAARSLTGRTVTIGKLRAYVRAFLGQRRQRFQNCDLAAMPDVLPKINRDLETVNA